MNKYKKIDNIAKYSDITLKDEDVFADEEEEIEKVKEKKARAKGLDYYDEDGEMAEYDDIEDKDEEEEEEEEEEEKEGKEKKKEKKEQTKRREQHLLENEETRRESMMSAAYWFNEMHRKGAEYISPEEKRYLELIIIELSEFYFPNLSILPPDKDKAAVENIGESIKKFAEKNAG